MSNSRGDWHCTPSDPSSFVTFLPLFLSLYYFLFLRYFLFQDYLSFQGFLSRPLSYYPEDRRKRDEQEEHGVVEEVSQIDREDFLLLEENLLEKEEKEEKNQREKSYENQVEVGEKKGEKKWLKK
eukprot:CAMPEP_0201491040 /NCGR_PEP_ID=MMETSP0151_2-20130828/28420_1 /ASSEMBLY_ACC=CAM_ASM_000257 /TAXON_ID=200890 /ORGANISM="Paramoeba atlantica, Strain 621/1 / CCAP 1560/9" /LENGTH=124 /DNA_ID=CAMNT_0047877239 /DNA_START=31 /DNA_END=406 /DNA_ORIENTATION=-